MSIGDEHASMDRFLEAMQITIRLCATDDNGISLDLPIPLAVPKGEWCRISVEGKPAMPVGYQLITSLDTYCSQCRGIHAAHRIMVCIGQDSQGVPVFTFPEQANPEGPAS